MEVSQVEPRNRTTYTELQEIIESHDKLKPIKKHDLIDILERNIKLHTSLQKPEFINALKVFKQFLKGSETLLTNEIIDDFRAFVKRKTPKGAGGKTSGANIVTIINATSLPQVWLMKPLLKGPSYKKLKNFQFLTEKTRKMFVHFEQNAKQTKTNRLPIRENGKISVYKEFQVLKKELALIPRYNRLDRCLQFLRKINQPDITQVRESDFLSEKKYDPRCLKEISPLFANLHYWGFIDYNPFCNMDFHQPTKPSEIEFIKKESIDALLTYSSQAANLSHCLIRNLLLCTLAYDSCLRIGELLSLEIGDLMKEEGIDILRIRPEIQKGQNKNERYLIILFKSTSILLNRYIKFVRPTYPQKSKRLFVGLSGLPISYSAARQGIRQVQSLLSMELYHDRKAIITPHHFRRTFGTLNAPGLGLNLSLDELATRMRHEDPKTTRERYISQNVYLEKIKLKESINKKKLSNNGKYSPEKIEEFLNWLHFHKRIPKSLISEIKERLNHLNAVQINQEITTEKSCNFTLSEIDALETLKSFNVKAKSLRDFGLKNCICGEINGYYVYDADYIKMLLSEFILMKEAIKKLCITKQTIINNSQVFSRTVIGRVTLVKASAIQYYIENGGRWGCK